MFANVARTMMGRGTAVFRSRRTRVAHTLLFTAALVVSPGLCGACATGGCGSVSTPPDRAACTGVAVSDDLGPACCHAARHAGPARPDGESDRAPRLCCGGGEACDCLLEPRREAPVISVAKRSDVAAGAAAPVRVPITAVEVPGPVRLVDGLVRPPGRPVRVLYGVWRN